MLNEKGIEYEYREYREDPLSRQEIRDVLNRLGLTARDVLRRNDRAYREAGLTGNETDAQLVTAMAAHPTLLQRPIGIRGEHAVVGRPVEKFLEL
ncbi:MAG: arsenate reductase [Gemmatimonadota bacterium]|nr:MAG: arsenate reductase [Gemmatimonadota bacterium]